MPTRKRVPEATDLLQQWTLPAAATLGSSVRARGILLEMRARLPFKLRKALDGESGALVLRLPQDQAGDFATIAGLVSSGLEGIESLPVIPREIEDILSIKTIERHRWLKDGRLQSAGTRTVRLRGRAKKITFHVFDPRYVEDVLDRDLVDAWREADVLQRAENRRNAAFARRLTAIPKSSKSAADDAESTERPNLRGWAEFEKSGLLR